MGYTDANGRSHYFIRRHGMKQESLEETDLRLIRLFLRLDDVQKKAIILCAQYLLEDTSQPQCTGYAFAPPTSGEVT